MRISDWSSDVCSSDLDARRIGAEEGVTEEDNGDDHQRRAERAPRRLQQQHHADAGDDDVLGVEVVRPLREFLVEEIEIEAAGGGDHRERSEEHTSELQSLMRISYAVFCLKKKNNTT